MSSVALIEAGEALMRRLLIFEKMAKQAKEQGRDCIEFHPDELLEAPDRQAMKNWQQLVKEHTGKEPLPFDLGVSA